MSHIGRVLSLLCFFMAGMNATFLILILSGEQEGSALIKIATTVLVLFAGVLSHRTFFESRY